MRQKRQGRTRRPVLARATFRNRRVYDLELAEMGWLRDPAKGHEHADPEPLTLIPVIIFIGLEKLPHRVQRASDHGTDYYVVKTCSSPNKAPHSHRPGAQEEEEIRVSQTTSSRRLAVKGVERFRGSGNSWQTVAGIVTPRRRLSGSGHRRTDCAEVGLQRAAETVSRRDEARSRVMAEISKLRSYGRSRRSRIRSGPGRYTSHSRGRPRRISAMTRSQEHHRQYSARTRAVRFPGQGSGAK